MLMCSEGRSGCLVLVLVNLANICTLYTACSLYQQLACAVWYLILHMLPAYVHYMSSNCTHVIGLCLLYCVSVF